ncbi:hypothetical protein CMV_024308 [Castanea mollissima]|uniref:Pentatricopeptide repeat-containing protein n=1 Tax=Castanea mollissima TaxID=60419 RepID=A0A8J4V9T0_9ROSI|nr:hypothetical protein CMV_024308 [Castanea mollissima]
MRRRGHTLDIFAYNMLLDALAKDQKNCDRLNRLTMHLQRVGWLKRPYFSSKMVENDCRPNEFTYSVILNVLAAEGQLGRLDEVRFCKGNNLPIGKLKQIYHLHDLFEKMKQHGPSPDIFTYNILISSFGRAGKVDEAIKIFEELENSNCKADIVSYNSLINCLGKNGDLDEAHMRFKEMQEKGFTPDVVTYSTLIECFGKTDKVEMACRLFDEMLAEGCYPNIVTYNILLDCLERCGRTAEAVDLYAKLKQQGLTPDSITYTVLERLQSGSHRKVRFRRQSPITGWVVSPLRKHLWFTADVGMQLGVALQR